MTRGERPGHRRRLLAANAVGALFLAGCPLAGAALPPEGRVLVSITPGKPDAPTETVTVSWRGATGSLRSERRAAGGNILAEGEASLGETPLRQLWRSVEDNHLTAFRPRKSSRKAFDFGQRQVRLEWVPRAGEARQSHDFSWTAPLDNDAEVRPLLLAAASAARGAVPGVLLAYFPETGPGAR